MKGQWDYDDDLKQKGLDRLEKKKIHFKTGILKKKMSCRFSSNNS